MAFYEYQVTYLAPGEPTASWDTPSGVPLGYAIAEGYGAQLTGMGREGWEVTQWALPWVLLRRAVTDGAQDQARPHLPEGDIPLRGTEGIRLEGVTKELLGTLRDLRKIAGMKAPKRNEGS